jgi:glycosyltransferase involved in cell wall biosynthesis
MHVAFVSQFVYPHDWETRLTKSAASLLKAGHRVTVFSKAEKTSKIVEEVDGMTVRRLRANTLPLNPRWFLWLARMFKEHKADVAIVRNLRLAPASILAGRLAGIPVIMDLGENHPAHVEALGKRHIGHYIMRSRRLVGALERWCVGRADEVWVVAEANRQRLASVVRDGTKIRLIRNMPELDGVPEPGARSPARRDRLRLVYLGILDNLRGLEMLLHALALSPDAELVLVGDGSELPMLEALADELGLEERVMYRGWVSGPRRFDELRAADVGVIPHRVTTLTQTTEPNKLFDYMLCGLPVLSTPLEPVRAVVEEVGCGVIAAATPEGFAAAIARLARDPAERAAMGERGRRAVLDRYNWERESRQVLAGVAELG